MTSLTSTLLRCQRISTSLSCSLSIASAVNWFYPVRCLGPVPLNNLTEVCVVVKPKPKKKPKKKEEEDDGGEAEKSGSNKPPVLTTKMVSIPLWPPTLHKAVTNAISESAFRVMTDRMVPHLNWLKKRYPSSGVFNPTKFAQRFNSNNKGMTKSLFCHRLGLYGDIDDKGEV